MRNPFTELRRPWLAVALAAAATVALAVPLELWNRQLRACGAPKGIAGLELARTASEAQALIDSWRRCGAIAVAKRSVALDNLFIPAYSTLLALLWFAAARWLEPRARGPSTFIAGWGWAMWAAGALDYVENWCDWRMLERGATDVLAAVSSTAATVKFVVTLVLVHVLF